MSDSMRPRPHTQATRLAEDPAPQSLGELTKSQVQEAGKFQVEIAFLPHWWDGAENIKFSDRKNVCVLHTCGLKSLMELEYMFPE